MGGACEGAAEGAAVEEAFPLGDEMASVEAEGPSAGGGSLEQAERMAATVGREITSVIARMDMREGASANPFSNRRAQR